MTEPPAGWTNPGEQPAAAGQPGYGGSPGYGPPPGYGGPPAYGGYPPPGYAPPPGYPPPGYGPPPGYAPYGYPAFEVRPGVIPLRPLTLGELLDGAVKVIRRYPKPALGISALVALATTVVNVLLVLTIDFASLSNDLRNPDGTTTGPSPAFTFRSGSSGPGFVVSTLAGLVLTGALVVLVGKAVLGQPATFGEVWQEVRPRLLRLLGLSLLTGLILAVPPLVGVLLAALLVAAAGGVGAVIGVPLAIAGFAAMIYLYPRLALAPAVLLLEKSTVRTALSRSGALVKGSWWRVAGILVLTSIIAALVAAVIEIPLSAVGVGFAIFSRGSTGSLTALFVAMQVAAGLASVLVGPFTAGVHALLYVDRRMRAEGLDLTLQQAAARA